MPELTEDIIHFDLLKAHELEDLIAAIKEIMQEGAAHNLANFNANYWNWQYQKLPTAKANIYVARNANNKILAYYHVPLYNGKLGNAYVLYAMIQDVAVSNTLRGRGIFKDLATFANKHLDEQNIEVVYTFPNAKSMHTFVKYNNFSTLLELPAYILPLSTSLIIKSKINLPLLPQIAGTMVDSILKYSFPTADKNFQITLHDSFTPELEAVYTNYNKKYLFCLQKNVQYLNWRFVEKGKHYIISIQDISKKNVSAVAVFKADSIMGMSCLLLMDYAYLNDSENCLVQLIAHLRAYTQSIFGQKFALLFTSANTAFNNYFKQAGFFKIPPKKNPRPLNLLVRAKTHNNDILNANHWNITLSDWDVF
jgi:hypothetical protein